MHGAKAGRLDQNIRVNFGLGGKTDSPFRQFVDIDAATPNFAVDDARRSNRIRRYVKSNFATAFSTLKSRGRAARHRNCRA